MRLDKSANASLYASIGSSRKFGTQNAEPAARRSATDAIDMSAWAFALYGFSANCSDSSTTRLEFQPGTIETPHKLSVITNSVARHSMVSWETTLRPFSWQPDCKPFPTFEQSARSDYKRRFHLSRSTRRRDCRSIDVPRSSIGVRPPDK